MLQLFTSLSFLYAFTIAILLLYGFLYYRTFVRSGYQRRRFPVVFLLTGAACFSFLWFNIHASLKLKTFSNLDHYFIRHDGFNAAGTIELGRTDTVNSNNNSFSHFVLSKKNNQVTVASTYSEDPFYVSEADRFHLLSVAYPATGHAVLFQCDTIAASIRVTDSLFVLQAGNQVFSTTKPVKKGATLWNIFKDENGFINSSYYTYDKLSNCLKNILVVRDNVSKTQSGELKYFLSGRLFQYAARVRYDERDLETANQQFTAALPDKSSFAWGVGFLDNNRNQFRISYLGNDSFSLINRYPVSYPLTEENNNDWTPHSVNKFLVSDSKDILNMPAVFREGFLFSAFSEDSTIGFAPVLLSYRKAAENDPVQLNAKWLNHSSTPVSIINDKLVLPAKSSGFGWVFSMRNTYNWELGNRNLSPKTWQLLLFGTLLFFFVMVFFSSWLKPADKLSWVWQLLSCVTIVLLSTRFFLYWRYKSFPPYEGMDLASQQQLQSFWNFGVIIFTGIVLAVIFGWGLLKYMYELIRRQAAWVLKKPFAGRKPPDELMTAETINHAAGKMPFAKQLGSKSWFFISWMLVLVTCSGFAAARHFDPGICRHLAIGLMIVYFMYVFISYKHSPLVAATDKSWWKLSTGNVLDIVVSNPVKVFLSVSLLAVFVFIDIGFAIVFINFLLFNEAFLCINYAMAGLSAGSQKNARTFGFLGFMYLLLFAVNLLYAPYILKYLLALPQTLYLAGYILFAIIMAYNLVRLLVHFSSRQKLLAGIALTVFLFVAAILFFPKEKILEKAAITKYRIDVLTIPVDKAIETAYEEGSTYEPVIRAAQNQWFINTFIYEKNNPGVNSPAFHLLPQAPQNKGARYNAQATDLVASRFFIAEHGKWSVLLYVFLLLLPTTMLASFYKLYPDFTNRINTNYPTITAGFSILNYLLITALLVILAATGRYIFFGQDLPFGSILSKQSVLFPSLLIVGIILLFKNIPLERYANRKKFIPGILVFSGLALLLFFVKPVFNKDKEFNVADLAKDMDSYIQLRLQPILDHFDTSAHTKRFSIAKKDQLFTDSVRKIIAAGSLDESNKFFANEITAYTRAGFSRHLDQSRMLYLNLYSGSPQLAVNDNYFRIEPPPHLQQTWTGNVFGDTTVYNVSLWDVQGGTAIRKRLSSFTNEPTVSLSKALSLSFRSLAGENLYRHLYLVNKASSFLRLKFDGVTRLLEHNDSIMLDNPYRISITDSASLHEQVLITEPDAFMKNYYVNGNRFYVYPMENRFTWARNFAESISSEYSGAGQTTRNAFVSFDYGMMDSLSVKIQNAIGKDTSYKKGAEYGICIADGNGRLIAMSDFIKGMNRPDPNDKAGFNKAISGEDGSVSQSLLRKQIGNINLLRLNPGPGSTLKPIVFSAIASQLNLDWDAFAAEGFSEPQHYYGGEKVAEYDFEKNNGRISKVTDYIKFSDNYYHSNVLLLGSYPKQNLNTLLAKYFASNNPDAGLHWPYFNYRGTQYWLNGFENWPGYMDGKANFGTDSSFVSTGLLDNYGIYTHTADKSFEPFATHYDSLLFLNAYRKSGFILPEYALFDQQGENIDKRIPYDVFTSCFRGHVKGSSQVMIPPAKMLEAFGKMISQSRNYTLTLNPYAPASSWSPFYVDSSITYNNYLSIMRDDVFTGMHEALFAGTAARLGALLKDAAPYYYYAKTGTTGDNESKSKSKLFTIIISLKNIADPGFNFRNNKFYTIYFTSQNGAPKQNEEFQAAIIKYVQHTPAFNKYMNSK